MPATSGHFPSVSSLVPRNNDPERHSLLALNFFGGDSAGYGSQGL
jgi:hypothetical protein